MKFDAMYKDPASILGFNRRLQVHPIFDSDFSKFVLPPENMNEKSLEFCISFSSLTNSLL